MKRLLPLDRVLLGILAPVWLVCVVLHLDRQIADPPLAWVPLYVTPSAGQEPPVVHGWWPETPAEERVLEPGDRLLRVADDDLSGAGRFSVWARLYEAASPDLEVPVAAARDGAVVETTLTLRAMPHPWQTIPLSLALGLSALLVLWRGGGSPAARAYAMGAIAYSLQWSFFFGGRPWTTHAGLTLFFASALFYQPLTLRAALMFPDEVAIRSRLPYLLSWSFAVTAFGLWVWLFGSPLSGEAGLRLLGVSYGLWILVFLGVLARNYRRADGKGRRQLRWVLYGFYVGLGPVLVGSIVFGARPELRGFYELSLLSTVLIPPCLYVAFLAYNLYDINRLITTTLAYSVVVSVALGVILQLGAPLADWLARTTGLDRTLSPWLVAAAVVGMVPVLAQAFGPALGRSLFREQYRFEQGIRALGPVLAGAGQPAELLTLLGRGIENALSLESLVIHARTGDAFVPVFAAGSVVPPAFPNRGTLAALLAATAEPVDEARIRVWLRSGTLSGAEASALQGLDVAAILPIRRGEELEAFLCLGRKQSGDIFTRSDLTRLEGMTERASAELLRFEQERLFEEHRRLYERVIRYAPGAFREELARGGDLSPGEREVTIVFVAFGGAATRTAEGPASVVFDRIGRAMEAVSRTIRDHGGSVVEFHGSGLMAAFGAPASLDDKERAAVEAARAVVKRSELDPIAGGEEGPRIGVGIATGPDWVGTVQAVDRRIWVVIGNTTNLAARLLAQASRLDASIVIDALTAARAGASAADFVAHEGIRLKGRSGEHVVHALPRRSDRVRTTG